MDFTGLKSSPVLDVEEPVSVGQYVRTDYGNGKSEIGVVCSVEDTTLTITTSNGYDVTVRKNNVRKAFLLILDLNGVLVARGRGVCIHRPYAKEFLRFAFENFAVGVWTSGLRRSCDPIIESVMGEYKNRLLFTYYRDKCVPAPTPENEFGTKKNLKFIFDMYPDSFHSVNTIIIDDSPEKCSHPDIALCPVPFKDPATQRNDEGLKKVITVLEEVLALNSHFPLIRAAEERLARMRQEQQPDPQRPAVHSAEGSPVASGGATASVHSPSDASGTDEQLAEVNLWSYRLCCDYLQGSCTNGDRCHFRHDADDGVSPCSRKGTCTKGHAKRWKR